MKNERRGRKQKVGKSSKNEEDVAEGRDGKNNQCTETEVEKPEEEKR